MQRSVLSQPDLFQERLGGRESREVRVRSAPGAVLVVLVNPRALTPITWWAFPVRAKLLQNQLQVFSEHRAPEITRFSGYGHERAAAKPFNREPPRRR